MISFRTIASLMLSWCGACVLPPKSVGDAEGATSTTTTESSGSGASSAESTASTGPADGVDSTGTEITATSSASSGPTCRQAIDCMVGCLIETDNGIPTIECLLACEDGMAVDELMALLDLTACVEAQCQEYCEWSETSTGEPETSTGEPGTSTGEPETGTSTGPDIPPEHVCNLCVLGGLTDLEPPGCMELAAMCT